MAKLVLPKIKLDQEPTIRERVFFVLVLGGLAIFFVNILWTPISQDLATIAREKKSAQQQVDAVKKLLDATKAQLVKTRAEPEAKKKVDDQVRKILERRVADVTDEINSTVDLLTSRNVARRIKVKNVSVGDRSDMPGYAVIPIEVELSGPYTGVQGFLEAIEALGRPVIIRAFDIERSGEDEGELLAKLFIDLYIAKR